MIRGKKILIGMFRRFIWLEFLLLATCHSLQPLDHIEQDPAPKEAWRSFTHEGHRKAFNQYHFDCQGCHPVIEGALLKELSPAGKESCHLCHSKKSEKLKKALNCFDCHLNMKAIEPADHRTDWVSTHGTKVHLSEIECSQCHSNRSCVKCHSRRDKAARNFHRGSALMTHAAEARVDPVKCQQCHRVSYCHRCHQSGFRPGETDRRFHRGPALMTHPQEARVDSARCLQCHPISHCSRCH